MFFLFQLVHVVPLLLIVCHFHVNNSKCLKESTSVAWSVIIQRALRSIPVGPRARSDCFQCCFRSSQCMNTCTCVRKLPSRYAPTAARSTLGLNSFTTGFDLVITAVSAGLVPQQRSSCTSRSPWGSHVAPAAFVALEAVWFRVSPSCSLLLPFSFHVGFL